MTGKTEVKRMQIVVLAGGLSYERDVSLLSGGQIAHALRQAGHRVVLVDAYTGWTGHESAYPIAQLFRGVEDALPFHHTVPTTAPDLDALRRASDNGEALLSPLAMELCQYADLVFIGLHGGMGENGLIQAALEVAGIRFTGTAYAGCLLAMDKHLAKILMRAAGIATPDWEVLTAADGHAGWREKAVRIGFPCVAKPCNNGSSIGVTMLEHPDALETEIAAILQLDEDVILERKITGREFSVGVLDGRVLPIIEITPVDGFYDYVNKYQAGRTIETCPAQLPRAITADMQATALHVGTLLRLRDYYRVDFLMDQTDFYCLEANTLPGMTPTSLIPQEAAAAGIDYIALCDRIARLAAARP